MQGVVGIFPDAIVVNVVLLPYGGDVQYGFHNADGLHLHLGLLLYLLWRQMREVIAYVDVGDPPPVVRVQMGMKFFHGRRWFGHTG
jgi:hypothetical protein